jgi:phosphoribosylanthranilate isomerase
MTFIKFCGMTREADVQNAGELGVHALGFVMWPGSPRFVERSRVASLVKLMPQETTPVGVLVAPSHDEIIAARDAGLKAIQVHGMAYTADTLARLDAVAGVDIWIAASLEQTLEAIPVGRRVLLDAHDPIRHGGTGRTIDWQQSAAAAARFQLVLAGGLTAQNVAAAIRTVGPFGVDVASGIEDRPGIKNAQAMKSFVAAVHEADRG